MGACAETGPKPVTLELGGKSPQVVFDDIDDIDRVANTISRAILNNAGQVCLAGSRLIVQRSIAEKLIELIAERAALVKAGPTWEGNTNFSPIISVAQSERIAGIVDRSLEAGASALIGGDYLGNPEQGSFYQPTILVDVQQGMEAVTDEIFGPVLTVQIFDDEDEAFALANNSHYGLSAGIYTSNLDRGLRALRKLEVGTVWINRYGRSADFIIPTGGYKKSGIGKDLGRQVYESNLRYKSALIAIGQN